MSRFYGSLNSGSGEVTRGGGPNTPLSGHVRGWAVGARVSMSVDKQGRDVVTVHATTGSRNSGHDVLLAEFTAGTRDLCGQCANQQFGDGCTHGHANAFTCQNDHPGDFVTHAEEEARRDKAGRD